MISLRRLPPGTPPPVTGKPEYDKNVAAWWAMQPSVEEKYPKGHFLAFYEGEVVADATTFAEVLAALRAIDPDRHKGMIARVGIDVPQEVVFCT